MSDDYSSGTDINKPVVVSRIKKLDRKYGKVANIDTKIRDPFIPPGVEDKIRESVVKNRGFTPNDIAQKNDVRVSAAKKLLKKLEEEGLVVLVSSSRRLKIYRGKDAKV